VVSTHAGGTDLLERLGHWIVRLRTLFFALGLGGVVLGTWVVSHLKLHDDPSRWPPPSHPFVQLNDRIQERFGGTNLVSITVSVKEGDVFTLPTLAKVKRMTEKLLLVQGIIPYTVNSLSSIHTKSMKFHPGQDGEEDLLEIVPLMDPNRAPQTREEAARIKEGAYNKNSLAQGFLVSPDGKSARILADFRTVPYKDLPFTDPVAIYKAVQDLIGQENDASTVVGATGTPIIIGWVNSDGLYYIWLAFGFLLVGVATALWVSFHNVPGVVLPISVGLLGSLFGFVLYRLFFGDVLGSASVLIAPFIIVASGSCHAVQFLKRFFDDELPRLQDVRIAAVVTFASRFVPMFIALVTEMMAFVVLSFVPFENVRTLGIVTSLGMLSVTLGEFFFVLPVLTYLPRRSVDRAVAWARLTGQTGGWSERWVRALVRPLVYSRPVQWATLGSLGVLVAGSLWTLQGFTTGQDNTYAIHNYLTRSWEGNSIYEMEMDIRQRFGGVYPLTILIEAQGGAAKEHLPLQKPAILKKMDAFAAFLEKDTAVHGVVSLPLFIKYMHRFMSGEKDEDFLVPDDPTAIGTYFYFYESGQPGAFDAFVDPSFHAAVLTAIVEDTRPDTVTRLLAKAERYAREQFNDAQVRASVAGGAIGIAGAFNESIGTWLLLGTLLSTAATYVAAMLLLRSFVMPALLLVPLAVAMVVWLAIMQVLGIEMNSNMTTALAIASGVGIDAEVYLLYRFREELLAGRPFGEALVSGFTLIRRALVASNAALILGCWALVPIPLYVGYVGFGMGLILLLTFLVSFVASPVLWAMLRPAFLLRGIAETATEGEVTTPEVLPGQITRVRSRP